MAYPGSQTNAEFGAGISHMSNPGRQNIGSVTLGTDASTADQGLGQTSQHWAAMTPHGVLASATGGSPADTDAGVEFGQQGLGDHSDAAMAGQSWDRALMGRAAGIGQDDGVA
jgi:hypothetical protein